MRRSTNEMYLLTSKSHHVLTAQKDRHSTPTPLHKNPPPKWWLLCIVLFLLAGSVPEANAGYWYDNGNYKAIPSDKGDGSPGNPYQISEPGHIGWLMLSPNPYYNKHFKLMKDIDMSAHQCGHFLSNHWDVRFTGTFDGNGHTITGWNMSVEWNSVHNHCYHTGFIQSLGAGGVIKNLTLKNSRIKGETYRHGVIVGYMYDGLIDNVIVDGANIYGLTEVGGFVGRADGGTIKNCTLANSTIGGSLYGWDGWPSRTGGFVGFIYGNLVIKNCSMIHSNIIYDVRDDCREGSSYGFGLIAGEVHVGSPKFENLNLIGTVPNYPFEAKWGTPGLVGYNRVGKAALSGLFKNIIVRSDSQIHGAIGGQLNVSSISVSEYNNSYGAASIVQKTWQEQSTYATAYLMNSFNSDIDANEWMWGYQVRGDYGSWVYPMGKDKQTVRIETQKTTGVQVTKVVTSYGTFTNPQYSYAQIGDSITIAFTDFAGVETGAWVATTLTGVDAATYRRSGYNEFRAKISKSGSIYITASHLKMPFVARVGQNYASQVPSATFDSYTGKTTISWVQGAHRYTGDDYSPGNWLIFRKELNASSWGKPIAKIADRKAIRYEDGNLELDKTYVYKVGWADVTQNSDIEPQPSQSTGVSLPVETTLSYKVELEAKGDLTSVLLKLKIPNNTTFNNTTYKIYQRGKENSPVGSGVFTMSGADAHKTIEITDDAPGDACTSKYYIASISGFGSSTAFYGKTFVSEEAPATLTGNVTVSNFRVSKGEYASTVKLSWDLTKPVADAELQFLIYRRVAESDAPFELMQSFYSKDRRQTYTDEQVVAGINYEYSVEQHGMCNGSFQLNNTNSDIGFCQTKGTVSGQIAFGSGTAVENATVVMRRTDLTGNATQYRALQFDAGSTHTKWYMGKAKQQNLFGIANYSIQAYIQPSSTNEINEIKEVFSLFYHSKLCVQKQADGTFKLIYYSDKGDKSVTSAFTIPADRYAHINIVRTGTVVVVKYVNDQDQEKKKIEEMTLDLETNDQCNWTEEALAYMDIKGPGEMNGFFFRIGGGFNGCVDEIRVWKKALTDVEIFKNYDRLLMGDESGLTAYFTFDEGLSKRFFDSSSTNGTYNDNHGYIESAKSTGDMAFIPLEKQLALKGYTDSYGNYIIAGVPFVGSGSVYSIVPSLGVHQFKPAQSTRLIGQGSLIHNGTDFSDVSSFEVNGKVTYKGTNIPVDGVRFYVDGNLASKDGKPVQSANDGTYTLDVPIGEHHIEAELNGHVFAYKGRWPRDREKWDFQQPTKNVNFVDSTTVTIVGRVAGGDLEYEKPVGFGTSKANIGQATIVMDLVNNPNGGYSLNDSTTVWSQSPNAIGKTTITVEKGKSAFTVKTDSLSGEYTMVLPPVALKILEVSTKSLDKTNFAAQLNIVPNVLKTYADTLNSESTQKEFVYHSKHNILYKAKNPTIKVTAKNNSVGAFGESNFDYFDPDGTTEKVPLYTVKEGNVEYKFGHPVFEQGTRYELAIQAFEEYTNTDDGIVIDRVPLSGKEVTVENGIGRSEIAIFRENGAELTLEDQEATAKAAQGKVTLNEKGEGVYAFLAGFPKVLGDHLLPMNIYVDNGRKVEWSGNNTFKGYVLGSLQLGSNFVTAGPDIVTNVIRDPGGSNSYAYWEAGKSTTHISMENDNHIYNQDNVGFVGIAPTFTVSTGLGVAVEVEVKAGVETESNMGYRYQKTTRNNSYNTIETFERKSTSASPDFVGANGDLYIGNSTNMVYGGANVLSIRRNTKGSPFEINAKEMLVSGLEFSTIFQYTQHHIENALIPSLIELRNKKLIPVDPGQYNLSYPNATNSVIYITALDPKKDPNFGKSNYDEAFGEKAVKKTQPANALNMPSYIAILPKGKQFEEIDSINYLNMSIQNWKDRIADNEKTKLATFKNSQKLLGNKSFDAGATVEFSSTKRNVTENSTYEHDYVMGSFSSKFIQLVNEAGASFEVSLTNENYTDRESGTTTEDYTTLGYVLADENTGDYFSIDTYDPGDNTGLIFRTRGGMSMNPYEVGDTTKYYEPLGTALSATTMQVEKPVMYCAQTEKYNVPSGSKASFEIEIGNNSDSKADLWYNLRVDEKTNPNGAILAIDGQAIGNGRKFLIKGKDLYKKTLTIAQGPSAAAYDSIRVVLESEWQSGSRQNWPDIEAELYLSTSFVTACTPISLVIPDRVVNLNNTKEILKVKVKDYDINYKNFGAIWVQYKKVGEQNWSLIKEYVNNENLVPVTQSNELIGKRSSIDVDIDMYGWPDGKYEFRAVTRCADGPASFIENESEVITVTRDMHKPTVMGKPSPANGILTPESEVSILFNEAIQGGLIRSDSIRVVGVLNGHKVANNVGLEFASNNVAYTELPINTNGAYSIEAWIKRKAGKAGTLFAYGTGEDMVTVGFNKDNKAVVTVGKTPFISDLTTTNETWQYISFSYKPQTATTGIVNMKQRTDAGAYNLLTDVSVPIMGTNTGRLYVGANADKSNGFDGAMRQLTMWSEQRSATSIATDFNLSKSGRERNLIGYWPLDDGKGTLAVDKSRGRNLTLQTGWFIHPKGKSMAFNGTNQSVELDFSKIPMTDDDNFTVQFWFKADAAKENQTLFSIGHGVKDESKNKSLSVRYGADKMLQLLSKGEIITVSKDPIEDNIWHHFALSVTRNSNAVAFIDGVQTLQTNASNIGAPSNSKIALGVSRYRETEASNITYADYFQGSIDEVRIYNSALTAENIRLDMYSKLKGNELGLKAYYPFDKYIIDANDQFVVSATANDQWLSKENGGAAVVTGATFSDSTPAIKDVRSTEDVAHSITVSENKILFNITEDIERVEGCVLEFSVGAVTDMNGNPMKTETWTAYVMLNRLKWATDAINIKKEALTSQTFKANITNTGGTNESFELLNIPIWLSPSTLQGTLKPLETAEITFTIDQSLPIGAYETSILLKGSSKVTEVLPVNIKVQGNRPNWSVNPADFENTMNVIGAVTIEGVYQEDSEDLVAAFIGSQCVGVSSPRYVASRNGYSLFLDVYGNGKDVDKNISFSLWDASTGRIYPDLSVSTGDMTFVANSTIGTIANPTILNALDRIEQAYGLNNGWNWISVNVDDNNGSDIFNQFKTKIENAGIQLKNVDSFTQYTGTDWFGKLNSMDVKQGYMLKTSKAYTLKLTGKMAKADLNPISLEMGWNWIGYIPQFSTTPKDAFAGLAVEEGDFVKTQKGFSVYASNEWIGSLEYLKANEAYLFKSAAASKRTFTYPLQSSASGNAAIRNAKLKADRRQYQMKWEAKYNDYESNMTMIAIVRLDDIELTDEKWEIGAFEGNVCRGSVRLENVDLLNRTLAFLTIAGVNGENIEFRLYDPVNDEVYTSIPANKVRYTPNDILGTPNEPIVLDFKQSSSIENGRKAKMTIYPTRVKTVLTIDYPLEDILNVEVFNESGAIIISEKTLTVNQLDVSRLAEGFHFVRITTKNGVYIHRIIKE